jgi:MFS family permease
LVYATVGLLAFGLPFYLFASQGFSPMKLGAVPLAYGVWWLVLPPFTGRLSDRIGFRPPLLLGLALGCLGMLSMSMAAANASMPGIFIGLSLLGIGASFILPTSNAATMANVDPDDRASASGLNMTSRLLGSIVGIFVSATLLQSISGNAIPELGVIGGIDAAAMWVWRLGAVLMAVGIVVVLTSIRERDASDAPAVTV